MKKYFRNTAFKIAIIISLCSFANLSHASSCHNSPGKWFAAVFTGGISYQICRIRETINEMLQLVNETRQRMTTLVNDTISHSKQVIENRGNSIKNSVNRNMNALADINRRADAIALRIKSSTRTSSNSAEYEKNNTMKIAAESASREINRLRREANTQSAEPIRRIVGTSMQAANRHARSAFNIGNNLALEPLRVLGDTLLGLLRDPRNLFDPSRTIRVQVEAINSSIERTVTNIRNEVLTEAQTILGTITPQKQQRLQYNSLRIQEIMSALQNLDRRRTQQSLQRLNYSVTGRSESPQTQGGSQNQSSNQNQRSSSTGKVNISNTINTNAIFVPAQANNGKQNLINTKHKPSIETEKIKKLIKKITRSRTDLEKLQDTNYKLPKNIEKRAKTEVQKALAGKNASQQSRIKSKMKSDALNSIKDFPQHKNRLLSQFDTRFEKIKIKSRINSTNTPLIKRNNINNSAIRP